MSVCYFLAIAGGSGSGKSTLAQAIVDSMPAGQAVIIREDDYYICASLHRDFDPATHNFDEPAAKEQSLLAAHLVMLRIGRSIDRPEYDFNSHRRAPRSVVVRPAPLVVVEGLHVLASPVLASAFDASVFVDTTDEARLKRRLERDVQARGRTEESVRHQYESRVRPMYDLHVAPQRAMATLTVSGEIPLETMVALVRLQLPERLRG